MASVKTKQNNSGEFDNYASIEQMLRERHQKIQEYERFIEDRLKPDLNIVLESREKYYEQISKYLELKNNIQMLQEKKQKELKTKVNLGCAQMFRPDTTYIFVNVGLGFHAEMTLKEALDFIEVKDKDLTKHADELTQQAAYINSKIKLMYQGINDLVNIPNTPQ